MEENHRVTPEEYEKIMSTYERLEKLTDWDWWVYKKQRSACRFLLVDAYRESVDFYLKNGFTPIDDMPDLQKHTIPMYFDLADMDIH